MEANNIKPLPYPLYLWPVILITTIGIIDSVYLAISHYRVYTDIGYQSFCAISKAINCDTVSQSPYAVFLGLPVPIWGILGYTYYLIMVLIAGTKSAEKKRMWSQLFMVAIGFNIYSVALAFISTFIIKSYCIMCIGLYVVNFMLLYLIWIIRKRFDGSGVFEGVKRDVVFFWDNRKKYIMLFLPLSFIFISTWIFFPSYWELPINMDVSTVATGMTQDGHPWIGAEAPEIEITEFTDYQCFQCRKMHFLLRQLIIDNPTKIRLVHRHFPMDHRFNPIVKQPYHIGAGILSLCAISAATDNKFWEMNDAIFKISQSKKNLNLKSLFESVGLDSSNVQGRLNNPDIQKRLNEDIITGIRLGITATPSYLINGKVYQGNIPSHIIEGLY